MSHPRDVLFRGEHPFPIISACDHYAGTEKTMQKALALQATRGGDFDVTLDLEDGAPEGREAEHAELVASILCSVANRFDRAGVRIHPYDHPSWRRDLEIVVGAAGRRLSHVTIPKARGAAEVREVAGYTRAVASRAGVEHTLPLHVLIETHGALHEAHAIAAIDGVRGLDFGLMDFVSGHHGAIPEENMRSPGQFDHALVRRAKVEVVAAALAHGRVPAHNVTVDLNREQTLQDARRARTELGFLRMWSIHPEQIGAIIAAMTPDHTTVTRSGEILLAAQAQDWGPIRHGSTLHDRASYRYHWELLQRAHLAGVPLDPLVEQAFFEDVTPSRAK